MDKKEETEDVPYSSEKKLGGRHYCEKKKRLVFMD